MPPIVVEVAGGPEWWSIWVGLVGSLLTGLVAAIGIIVAQRQFRQGQERQHVAERAARDLLRSDEAMEVLRARLDELSSLAVTIPNSYGGETSPEDWLFDIAAVVDEPFRRRLTELSREIRVNAARLTNQDAGMALLHLSRLVHRMSSSFGGYISNRLDSRSEAEADRVVTLVQAVPIHAEMADFFLERYLIAPDGPHEMSGWHEELLKTLAATDPRLTWRRAQIQPPPAA